MTSLNAKLPPEASAPTSLDTSKPHWWRRLTDSDPISLEALRRLRVEPFDLAKDSDRTYPCWFDGKVLSHYLVSTGVFVHPISRRELTRDDCLRLDAHLRKHRLGKDVVVHAFDHQEDYKKKDTPENQVVRLQEEASTILRNLYSGGGGDRSAESSRQRGRDTRDARDAGEGRHADEEAEPEPAAFEETVALGGAVLQSIEDFPSLCDAPETALAPQPPLNTNWCTSDRVRGSTQLTQPGAFPSLMESMSIDDSFPSLGGSTGSAGSTGGAGGAGSASAPAPARNSPLVGRWANGAALPPAGRGRGAACAPVVSSMAPASAPQLTGDAFPSLGGEAFPGLGAEPKRGAGTKANRALVGVPAGKWGASAAEAVRQVPSGPPQLLSSDLAGAPKPALPPPPKEFNAVASDFPVLAPTPKAAPPQSREELIARNKVTTPPLSADAPALTKPP